MTEPVNDSAIALVGMSGRFPGAAGVGELWRNLLSGTRGLRPITDAELAAAGVVAGDGYVAVGGPVAGIEEFDAAAFGFSDREAETMEPQHRLLLECSWEALERAGYSPTDPGCPVGMFAGCAYPDYLTGNVPDLATQPGGKALLSAGVERDSLTSLVSYKLGLHGPSLTVQTYCSTSLVAVHLACQSLLTYECDMALAGGAALPLPQPAGYRFEEGGILSPDGRVRSLDADANGTVMGSGVAVVALKRLADALADGDVVHAVILGSAVNNDGRSRAGYTAPGAAGQTAVVETALAVAGVKPESIGYVECHAVGTPLGDSIELAALGRVFTTPRETPCVLSSVKPSIGHLDRASGVTGLVRAALSLRHSILPGTHGFSSPNAALAADRFTVLSEDQHWPTGPDPRRAGVSSFGVGGTNAHIVLEEAPQRPSRAARPGPHLLTFSAGDPAALSELTSRLRAHLASEVDQDLADVAYTLQISRGRFALRRAVVCLDREDAVAALGDPLRWMDGETRRRDPRVRLVAGDAPESWWAALGAAVSQVLVAEPAYAPDRDGVLAALAAGLSRIGVRVQDDPAALSVSVEPSASAAEWVLSTVASLWQAGASIDWAVLHGDTGRRVELPTYPFQRQRYWIDGPAPIESTKDCSTFLPTWREHPLPLADLDRRLRLAGPWLVFAADDRVEELASRLTYAGAEVITVRPGPFAAQENGDFTIPRGSDVGPLLAAQVVVPRTVVNGFGVSLPGLASPVVLTSGAVGVLGADLVRPDDAVLTASGRLVDVDASADLEQVLAALLGEGILAVRGGQTWARVSEPHPLPAAASLSPRDTVLLSGALAGTGLAEHLALSYGCRLILDGSGYDVDDLEGLGAVVVSSGEPDVVVHAASSVSEFQALEGSVGSARRIVLCPPDSAVAAHARLARSRWTVVEGLDQSTMEHFGGLLAAAHLAHVVISSGPVVSSRAVPSVEEGPARRPRPALATPFVEPDTGLERTVAEQWAAALGLAEIGADDNFFELGGRSATAVQIATRLGEACAVSLPLTAVVEHPTVRLLSAHLAG